MNQHHEDQHHHGVNIQKNKNMYFRRFPSSGAEAVPRSSRNPGSGARKRPSKQFWVERHARRTRNDADSPAQPGEPRNIAFRRKPGEAPQTLTPDLGTTDKFKPETRSPGGRELPTPAHFGIGFA